MLVGNSSSAIREAPSFKLPAVNIGTRQNNRLKAKNVIDVPNDTAKIIKAVNKALYDKVFIKSLRKIKNPYGDGNSAKKIVKILKKINLKIFNKKQSHIEKKLKRFCNRWRGMYRHSSSAFINK